MEKRSYIAFVSYRHTPQDAAVAKAVHRLIEEYVIPRPLRKNGKKHLGLVFRDEEELPVSSDLTDSICQALDRSRYLVVVCSEAARESQWVAREVQYFLQHHDRENVFVVLVQGEPQNVFPPEVTHIVNPETGEVADVEPLAIDARGSDGPSSVKKLKKQIKKLYAAMLGCAYDTLVQRDKKRRARQRAVLLSAAGAVVLLFMGMLLLKNGQLEDKNRQLQETNNAVLLRESQLLSANAWEALQEQDVLEAVRLSLSALPSPEQDRPYYAAAEAVLHQTAGPFETENANGTYAIRQVRQAMPIVDLYLTEDGRLLTLDEYGKMICCSAESGEELWSRDLTKLEEMKDAFGVIPDQFLAVGEDGLAVVVYNGALAAVRVDSGEKVWAHVPDGQMGRYSVSGDKRHISFMSRDNMYYGLDDTDGSFSLVTLSAVDGREISRVEIAHLEGGSGLAVSAPQGMLMGKALSHCAYLKDDTVIGVYLLESGTGAEKQEQYVYYRVNTETGEAKTLFQRDRKAVFEEDQLIDLVPVDEGKFLSVHNEFMKDRGIFVQMVDGESGNSLWETRLEIDDSAYFTRELYVFRQGKELILGIHRHLFSLDMLTGEKTSYQKLDQELAGMFSAGDFFACVLTDGTYSLGWRSKAGFSAGGTVKLGEAERIAVCGQGFVRAEVADGMVQQIYALSPSEGAGTVAAISPDDPYTVKLYTGLERPGWPKREVDLGTGKMSYYTTVFGMLNEDTLCLGPVSFVAEDFTSEYAMLMLNLRSDTVQMGPRSQNYVAVGYVHPLLDGSGYVMDSFLQTTSLVTREGTAVLADGTEMDVGGGYGLFAQRQTLIGKDTSANLRDGRVLTVRLHNGQIKLFFDGRAEKTVDLPKEIAAENVTHFAEPCGKVMLYLSADDATDGRPQVAVYDVAKDRWDTVSLAENAGELCALVPGEEKNLLLVHSIEGRMQMYDVQTGEMIAEKETNVTQSSLLGARFFLQDQYLLLNTKDGQLFVYDARTLTEKMRYLLPEGSYSSPAFVQQDDERRRLYFSCDGKAVCVDMRSWEPLFMLDNFLYFDAKDAEVYQCDSRYSGEGLVIITKVPDLEEMTQMGRQMLEENGG